MFPSLTVHHVIRAAWPPVPTVDVAVVIKRTLRAKINAFWIWNKGCVSET